MEIRDTKLIDCKILLPQVHNDSRGYFSETYREDKLNAALGYEVNFVQDNESFSSKGVLRGLHYQTGKYAQAKLIRVIQGRVLDVVVDLRKNSSTFSKDFSIELSEENKTQLFIPRGFAHGFIVLSDTAILSYKCDNFYNSAHEEGVIYNDKDLNIDWKLDEKEFIISDKDLVLPTLSNIIL
jgi:dTDP-4-dehydrorhamnose 3,5-epimerase